MREETLRMERVTYREQGVTQLENFSMSIWAGEIMGLMPVNRHGISALIKLLRQNLPLHYGYVYYHEKQVNHWRYSDSSMNRISVIQNKSCLAEGLTVADNICVLRPGFRKRLMQPKILRQQLLPFLEDIEMDIDADACIEELSPFERFVVELLKAVVAGNYLVVLDDISSFLSDMELQKLHRILRHYADKGMAFLYIAPHYEEVKQICDRTAVMKDGQIIKYFLLSEHVPDTYMYHWSEGFDRRVSEQIAKKAGKPLKQETAFLAEDLCFGEVKHLSFSVAPGECLVLQDLDNRFLPDLLMVLSGEKKAEQGHIRIGDVEFRQKPDRRIAIIQEVPVQTMLFSNLSYLDNLCFTLDHRFHDVWLTNKIKKSLRQEYAELLGEEVFDLRVEELSHKQKYDLIYMRILVQNPKVVFCVQPFKRAEVSIRIHVWELLERFLDKGIAVVILAVNLADSLALADRLIRVGKGRKREEYGRNEFGNLQVEAPWLYLYQEKEEE